MLAAARFQQFVARVAELFASMDSTNLTMKLEQSEGMVEKNITFQEFYECFFVPLINMCVCVCVNLKHIQQYINKAYKIYC